MSNPNHAADAIAADAVASHAILVDAIPAEPPQLAFAKPVAAEPHAVSADAVELPTVPANAVADPVEFAIDPEPTTATAVAAAA